RLPIELLQHYFKSFKVQTSRVGPALPGRFGGPHDPPHEAAFVGAPEIARFRGVEMSCVSSRSGRRAEGRGPWGNRASFRGPCEVEDFVGWIGCPAIRNCFSTISPLYPTCRACGGFARHGTSHPCPCRAPADGACGGLRPP